MLAFWTTVMGKTAGPFDLASVQLAAHGYIAPRGPLAKARSCSPAWILGMALIHHKSRQPREPPCETMMGSVWLRVATGIDWDGHWSHATRLELRQQQLEALRQAPLWTVPRCGESPVYGASMYFCVFLDGGRSDRHKSDIA